MITTHVLDTAAGVRRRNVRRARVSQGSEWIRVASGHTDSQGRLLKLTDGMEIGPACAD
jgi:5-hydroxyisourate hydrolase-like protein (transthyretin family)